jgi:hypothetical protein
MEVTEGADSMPALEIVPLDADQFTVLLKVPLPATTTEQGSDAPEANGEAQVGTTEETFDAGIAGELGDSEAEVPPPQPAARIANSKVVFVLLKVEAFPIFESRINLQMRDPFSSASHVIPIFEEQR